MSRESFLEDAEQLTSALYELGKDVRKVFSGADAVALELDMSILNTKIKLACIIIERKLIKDKIAPVKQQPIPLKL